LNIDAVHVPVAVVLDPEYGKALHSLVPFMPVWVIESPQNRAETEAIWAVQPKLLESARLTIFTADPDATSPGQVLSAILSDVDLHHGPYSQTPPFSALLVVGARAEDLPRDTLATYGLKEVTPIDEGVLVSTAHGVPAGSEHARNAG
jgi:hypothetical protein